MKSLTFTRGVALSVALFLLSAPAALAAVRPPLVSQSALAAQTGENTKLHLGGSATGSHAASSGTSSSIIRTLVALLVVIAVIYGIAWILKQFKGGRRRATGKGLEQVATLPLSGGRSVTLVRVGTELILLGVAEQSVTALRRYNELEAVEAGLRIDAIDADSDFLISDDPVLANEPLALPSDRVVPSVRPALPMPAAVRPATPGEFAGRFVESLRALTVRR